MTRWAGSTGLACALALCGCSLAFAQDPVAEFYKGKQVTITVGFASGGSASLYAQVLGRHMGRHLPGSPGFVVQHMPGAGGLVVTNHNANNAARDGTAFSITDRAVPLEPGWRLTPLETSDEVGYPDRFHRYERQRAA